MSVHTEGCIFKIGVVVAIFLMIYMITGGKHAPEPQAPSPIVNRHGQHIVTIADHKIAVWVREHPGAKIIAMSSPRYQDTVIVYMPSEPESENE